MSGTQIASYSAGFSFVLNRASITRLNAQIERIKKSIETKLGSINITGIKINAVGLNRALKQASANIVLPINNFSVNATVLRQQVQAAFSKGVTLRVNAVSSSKGTGSVKSRAVGIRSNNSSLESMAQFGSRAIPAFATLAGLGRINTIAQDITSNQMAINTVSGGRGVDAYNWLRNTGNELGIDYRQAAPTFTNYLGSSINKQGYDNSLKSYRDITTYGLTHGADNLSMERANLALGQMWSKGKVMAEELNTQLAEAKGFGNVKELFAKAYQESIGGKLTGQKADAALIDAMKKGLVKTTNVLPIVTRMMGEQSQEGIGTFSRSSRAAQNRFNNATTDFIAAFGRSGFDASMARFFDKLTGWLKGSDTLVRRLGAAFDQLVDFMEAVVESGMQVYNLFNSINPTMTTMLLTLTPLYKILGATGIAFLALAVAMDDVSHYVQGKDSVLGNVVSYMTELTGMDWNGIAMGLGIIGIAIAAAFSPLTAIVATIAALAEAYEYLKGLKAKETEIAPNSSHLPTFAELNAQNLRGTEKAYSDNPTMGNWFNKQLAQLDTVTAPIGGKGLLSGINTMAMAGAWNANPALQAKLSSLLRQGVISDDESERILTAIGGGYSTQEAMMSYLNQRATFNPNTSNLSGADKEFRIGVVNVIDTTAKELGFIESVQQASTQFTAPTSPPPTGSK